MKNCISLKTDITQEKGGTVNTQLELDIQHLSVFREGESFDSARLWVFINVSNSAFLYYLIFTVKQYEVDFLSFYR